MRSQSCKRLAAKRDHHPGKSGQRHGDLGSDRQGFTWFYHFALDRIQAARTNTKFGQDLPSSTISRAMMSGSGRLALSSSDSSFSQSHCVAGAVLARLLRLVSSCD